MRKRMAVAGVLWIGLATAPAWGQTALAWKLKEGEHFFIETVRQDTESNNVEGKIIVLERLTTSHDSYYVVAIDAKRVILERKSESVRFENHIKGMKDEATDAAASKELDKAGASIGQKLAGAVVSIVFDPALRSVVKAEGLNHHFARIADELPGRKLSLAADYNDESLKDETDLLFSSFLPAEPVSAGSKWRRRCKMPMGPMGGFEADGTFAYQGKTLSSPPAEKIVVAWKLVYLPPPGGLLAAGLPFKIKTAKLEGSTARGSYVFDAATGWLKSHEREVLVKGSLAVLASDKETEITMPVDRRETWKVRVLDQLPPK